MTRISGAQRGLNSFLDQIVNTRSDAAASAGNTTESGGRSAFDSQLARFSPNGNAGAPSEDSNASPQTTSEDTSSSQKNSANGVSALFAALTNGDESKDSSLLSTVQNGNMQAKANSGVLPQSAPSDAASALFAALAGGESGAAETVNVNASAAQSPTQLSTLLSLANMGNPTKATTDSTLGDGLLPMSRLTTAQKLAGSRLLASSSTASNLKRTAGAPPVATKHTDQTAATLPDLTASAQATVAMVTNALSPQTTFVPQPMRKDAVTSAPAANAALTQSKGLKGLSLDDVQSPSDAIQPLTQDGSTNPFADFSQPDESDSQSIKMTVSSIQAETHFAPVQQLSPTQQIFDFVALTGGVSSLADASMADAAAVNSSATSAAAPSLTASVAAPPVKTLTLALEPDALGSVTIKLRLVNSGLEVQVEAEKSDTTSLIEKDKDNLSDKLQSLGYSVDSVVVRTVATQGAHLDPSNDQSTAGQGQQQNANDASASGSSQNGGRNANDQSPAQNRGQGAGGFNQDNAADLSSNRTVGDGVYV